MTDLASSYDPKTFESRLYAEWESAGHFKPRGEGEPYTILLPPPNVTGTLHMGHAFQQTIMDALIRYHRMRGFDTLWQVGTDHAGIATEMVVARNLSQENLTRDGLGREGFIGKVWEWKAESGDIIERQMRRLGTSGDWSRSTFTMDPAPSRAVIEAFVRWHEEGLIYRGQRLVNWDPVLKTAISDLEVENVEEDGFLWSIAYPLADGSGSVTVATTRPETMLGDVAVMVHPEDDRYAHLIGKTVKLPLTDREIPVIADDYVDREFGTGVVKVTPAHDFNDYQVGVRHELPLINLFTPTAAINDNAPEKYRGLDRYDARKAVLADLEEAGLLVETKPHKLQVPRGDRTGQVIEPYLTDQWFVKMDRLARRGLELVENGEVKFVPPNWINTYRHWMENIQDWCISRQLWWGHRIPAWFDAEGRCYVGRDEAEARARAGLSADVALTQDSDVLETWFSSQLWPFSTLGWPDPQAMAARGYDRYLPSSVLVTGFDIIFFWVARMVMATDHFTGKVPFRDVYMTGLIRDKDGQKMSKSKGNVLDPLDIIDGISLEDLVAKRTRGLMQPKMAEKIEKATRKEFPDGIAQHGADALRFTIAALATHGRDIKFDLGRAEGYKNFCNKLWNASRFVLMNTATFTLPPQVGTVPPTLPPQAGTVILTLPPQAGEDARRADGGHPAGGGNGVDGRTAIPNPVTDAEKWILARLAKATAEAETHFANYRFDLLAQSLYEFAWNEFCDWFVELAKPALNGSDAAAADSTRHTLLHVLETLLRLLHPLIPFVTEELWQQVAPRLGIAGETISLRPYPAGADFAGQDFGHAEADVEWLKTMVTALRRVRSELNVAPSRSVRLLLQAGTAQDRQRIERHAASLSFLLKLEAIEWLAVDAAAPASAAAMVGELKLLVPLEGLVDLDAERTRLDKEIKRVEAEIGKCNGKLGNATFVQNAPAAVVEQERQRLAEWTTQLNGLREQRAKL
jgi:valyl-tRNA synthetase